MEKIFFAFLDELAHSKQFKKSRENDLLLTPPLVGKIPDNSGLFLVEGFPNSLIQTANDKIIWKRFGSCLIQIWGIQTGGENTCIKDGNLEIDKFEIFRRSFYILLDCYYEECSIQSFLICLLIDCTLGKMGFIVDNLLALSMILLNTTF